MSRVDKSEYFTGQKIKVGRDFFLFEELLAIEVSHDYGGVTLEIKLIDWQKGRDMV